MSTRRKTPTGDTGQTDFGPGSDPVTLHGPEGVVPNPRTAAPGAAYVALTGLSVKVGEVDGRKLLKRAAGPGDTCEAVPEASLAVLAAHDPRQIVDAAVYARLTPEQRTRLHQVTQQNRPYQRHSSQVAGWINVDLPEHAWLVETGLVPAKE